jgi:hypothetical protein
MRGRVEELQSIMGGSTEIAKNSFNELVMVSGGSMHE